MDSGDKVVFGLLAFDFALLFLDIFGGMAYRDYLDHQNYLADPGAYVDLVRLEGRQR